MAAAQEGRASQLACVIERAGDCVPLELEASAHPFDVADERYVLLVLSDMRDQNRRRILERLFFHDVLNTAGGVVGLGEVLSGILPESDAESAEITNMLVASSRQLLEEIQAQRDLAAAENGELEVAHEPVDVAALLAAVHDTYRHHPVSEGRKLKLVTGPPVTLTTDAVLLTRIVGNLVKNALEAIGPGQTVRLGHDPVDGGVQISVWNPGAVAEEARQTMFRRVFSTKGSGRGLGTYSVRLLAEQYLGGEVTWSSDEPQGTTVRILLPGAS
jgi:signal transduction histidine kinase